MTDENVPKISGVLNNQFDSTDEESKRWWAPEVFESKNYTKESDIWSFGILMWEICTFGGLPYSDKEIKDLEEHVKYERYRNFIKMSWFCSVYSN